MCGKLYQQFPGSACQAVYHCGDGKWAGNQQAFQPHFIYCVDHPLSANLILIIAAATRVPNKKILPETQTKKKPQRLAKTFFAINNKNPPLTYTNFQSARGFSGLSFVMHFIPVFEQIPNNGTLAVT